MKRALSILALSVLTACGGGCGGGGGGSEPVAAAPASQAPAAPVARDCGITLYGDSVQAGPFNATTPAQRIKALRPAYRVVDRSVGGEMASTRAATFNNETRDTPFVGLAHGVNDRARGTRDSLMAALRSMVTYAQAERRTVIMTGLPVFSGADVNNWAEFRDAVKAVAVETGAAYAGWDTITGETWDGTHPKQALSDAQTDAIIAKLDELAPECR